MVHRNTATNQVAAGEAQLRSGSGSAVSGEAGRTVAGYCRDDSAGRDLADALVDEIHKEQVALMVYCQRGGLSQLRAVGWAAVARESRSTNARHCHGNLDVYILDMTLPADSPGALTRITDDPGIDTEPQWSKDGQSLYFTSDRAGGPQIYKVGIHPGDKPRRLTFQGSYNARPRLSPDESQMAFVTQEDGAYRIATMDLRTAGTTPRSSPRDDSMCRPPTRRMVR